MIVLWAYFSDAKLKEIRYKIKDVIIIFFCEERKFLQIFGLFLL